MDVLDRYSQLRARLQTLNLYALVDGALYQQHRERQLEHVPGAVVALFSSTADDALAHAGPWLVDATQVTDAVLRDLSSLETTAPAVTWLIAEADLTGLSQLLQLRLDVKLPDGRIALLRFWDPRVLTALFQLMAGDQRTEFFGHIHEWHFLDKGIRVWIGRQHADAK
ncbi:DUF4123 domain-containing protein [Cupriavidus sp. WGlv3]|uniref:DUF4123 domain-containing protein n=1 Tax=Cupriavidus sp. WGlv3 TaxID=2919924 RepID=UPI0020912355|nr:DUF4123 domain-containing protein [Cupriavidus sp. WGlv3]MCO4864290.1 DUF4123 domain-containing protein [Cupriavidus sp. WGlv3]